MASYTNDPATQSILSRLAMDPEAVPHYSLHSGILRCRNKIWIGNDPILQQHLIAEFHSGAWGGYSGVPVTCMRLKHCFAWKGMKTAVKDYVQACGICQQSNLCRYQILLGRLYRWTLLKVFLCLILTTAFWQVYRWTLLTGRRNALTNAWRPIYAVMSMLAQKSGVSGCLRLSSGITPVTIQLLADLLLRPCMVIHLFPTYAGH